MHVIKQIQPKNLILTNLNQNGKVITTEDQNYHMMMNSITTNSSSSDNNNNFFKKNEEDKMSDINIHELKSLVNQLYICDHYMNNVVQLKELKRKFETAMLTKSLTQSIYPKEIKGNHVARIEALLSVKDGKYILDLDKTNVKKQKLNSNSKKVSTKILEEVETDDQTIRNDTKTKKLNQLVFGDLNIEKVIQTLQYEGIHSLKVTQDTNSGVCGKYTIEIPQLQSKIVLGVNQAQIHTNNKDSRNYLKEIMMQNLYIL
jgi:hypothetical protein